MLFQHVINIKNWDSLHLFLESSFQNPVCNLKAHFNLNLDSTAVKLETKLLFYLTVEYFKKVSFFLLFQSLIKVMIFKST